MYNPCVLAYVPPPNFGCARTFLGNIHKFKTSSKLILYSDFEYGGEVIKIKGSPEMVRGSTNQEGRINEFAVNNMVFFTGCRIAIKLGISHFLYMETDCRVGRDDWDGELWDELEAFAVPPIIAGSVACYNPCNGGPESTKRWEQLILKTYKQRNFPIATWGSKGANDPTGTSIFVNGAIGIYQTVWMQKLFPLDNTPDLSRCAFAWDYEIGLRLWQLLGVDAYDVIGLLTKSYSGYGEVITTEAWRMEQLRKGAFCAVHQVKSNETV